MSAYRLSGVTPLKDFPIAARETPWDRRAAEAAIRVWTRAAERPTIAYAACFFWHDTEAPELFGSYRLPYCDVIDDEVTAVPRAIAAVAAVLDGGRGGTTIPAADREEIKHVVAQWYARMAVEFDDPAIVPPWQS
jgi:hypothetical protein